MAANMRREIDDVNYSTVFLVDVVLLLVRTVRLTARQSLVFQLLGVTASRTVEVLSDERVNDLAFSPLNKVRHIVDLHFFFAFLGIGLACVFQVSTLLLHVLY
jgi:hypothetical protein